MNNCYTLTPDGLHAIIYIRGKGAERATLIDASDLPKVAAIPAKWYAQRRKWTWYAAATYQDKSGRKVTVRLHRYLLDVPEGMEADHVDHDGLNNTRLNLRIVTPEQNKENCRPWFAGFDIGTRWYESGCTDPKPTYDLIAEFF